jgi:hypothetical protein
MRTLEPTAACLPVSACSLHAGRTGFLPNVVDGDSEGHSDLACANTQVATVSATAIKTRVRYKDPLVYNFCVYISEGALGRGTEQDREGDSACTWTRYLSNLASLCRQLIVANAAAKPQGLGGEFGNRSTLHSRSHRAGRGQSETGRVIGECGQGQRTTQSFSFTLARQARDKDDPQSHRLQTTLVHIPSDKRQQHHAGHHLQDSSGLELMLRQSRDEGEQQDAGRSVFIFAERSFHRNQHSCCWHTSGGACSVWDWLLAS